VLAFPEGTVKKVFAILEICWHSLKELLKKVLASLDMYWHLQKEMLKSVGKLRKVLALAEGVVKIGLACLETGWQSQKELLKKCEQA
jgi:hypothetical protein